jgi:hypothetical protein
LLLYFLGNECDFNLKKVYDFAEKKSLQVVYVPGNSQRDRRKKFYATIPEFLWLVDNAEYVVTNSFHGSVFSTIFRKKFGVLKLSGKVRGMNQRLESLFELRRMKVRYIENDFSILDEEYFPAEIPVPENFLNVLNEIAGSKNE